MTDARTALIGAAIGLGGGMVLGGLLWLWFGGQGLPRDDVRGAGCQLYGYDEGDIAV